jgi:predicted dienelactone hydrolase
MSSSAEQLTRSEKALAITGLPLGPYPVGITTVQIDGDPKRGRGLQTEFWYPATDAALDMPTTKYSQYLGHETCPDPEAALAAANAGSAIGGYRDGISIAELDDPTRTTWMTNAVREAPLAESPASNKKWPLVVFSHGSGAYRASYSFWTEFLASHGFCVAACDHPGSARYTIVDGKVLLPISNRSKNEHNRPLDLVQIIDGVQEGSAKPDLFAKIDASNVAITGMSFGGFTTAATLEFQDPRIKAAVMMCSSMEMSGTRDYHTPKRKNKSTPVMAMIGTEDTVLGPVANDASRQYVDTHSGDAYLLEIRRGGHVSFTSCEMYDPEYGNGINAEGSSRSLTAPGTTYKPLPIEEQHAIINSYGLPFLNKYLKQSGDEADSAYLSKNHFDDNEVTFRSNLK